MRTKMQRNIINTRVYYAPCGDMLLGTYEGKLCMCRWLEGDKQLCIDRRVQKAFFAEYELNAKDDIIDETVRQLDEYFQGKRKVFTDIPLSIVGSPFQKFVWDYIQTIPYGDSRTYNQVADELDCLRSIRAVAKAVGSNAISVIIPCHRIVGSHTRLAVYAGSLDAKIYLLQHEYRYSKRQNDIQ